MPKSKPRRHYVYMSHSKWVEIENADILFHVYRKERKLGRLMISRGGIEWMPKSRSKRGRRVSWEHFIELIK